jgi:hypothetical protein
VLDLGGRQQPREQIGIAKQFRRIAVEHWYCPNHLRIAAANLSDGVSGSVPGELSFPAPLGGMFGGS